MYRRTNYWQASSFALRAQPTCHDSCLVFMHSLPLPCPTRLPVSPRTYTYYARPYVRPAACTGRRKIYADEIDARVKKIPTPAPPRGGSAPGNNVRSPLFSLSFFLFSSFLLFLPAPSEPPNVLLRIIIITCREINSVTDYCRRVIIRKIYTVTVSG